MRLAFLVGVFVGIILTVGWKWFWREILTEFNRLQDEDLKRHMQELDQDIERGKTP